MAESPQKRTKPTWLLWLLVAILVLILLCSAGLAYIFLRPTDSSAANATLIPSETPLDGAYMSPETTTTFARTTSRPITTDTSSTESMTQSSTSTSTVTTTTTTETATMAPTTETNKEMLSSCSAIIPAQVSCARTPDDVTATSSDWFSPLLYKLNLTVHEPLPKRPVDLRGSLQLFFTMNKESKQISLHAAQSLRGLEDVVVVDCQTGRTLCVSKSVSEGDVLSLLLSEPVTPGSVLRLDFNNFASASPRDVLYTKTYVRKMGQKLVKQLVVGSKLKNTGARGLLPSFDSSVNTARLSLCVKHWSKSEVRSNSPVDSSSSDQTCFQSSHPTTSDQFAFSVIEGADTLLVNSTTTNGQTVPAIELFIDPLQKNVTEKHNSIQDQASNVISKLSTWLGYPYPQEKLSIVYSPLQTDYISSLGLITLPDPAFEYPYHNRYHESLTRALVSQWTDGVLSTDDCLQTALTTYLGWKLDESLGYLERTAKKEINLIRPGDLSIDAARPSRFIRALGSNDCSSRDMAILYTLDQTYGNTSVTRMIREVLQKKAFAYASMMDWKEAAVATTGSQMAGTMIQEWFARKFYPVMKATIRSQQIDLQQLTTNPWNMIIEIAGSKGKYNVDLNELQQTIPFVSDDYVVIDPDRKSTAFVVYDADGYSRLKRCWDARSCPASQDALKSIFRDFGAVLRSNALEPMEEMDKAKWRDFLQFARPHMDTEARCCVSHILNQAAPEPDCYWRVEECKKLKFGRI